MSSFKKLFTEAVMHKITFFKKDIDKLNWTPESYFPAGQASKINTTVHGPRITYSSSKRLIDDIENRFKEDSIFYSRDKEKSKKTEQAEKQPPNVKIKDYRKISISLFKKLNYNQKALAIFAYYFPYSNLKISDLFDEMTPPRAKINAKTAYLEFGYESLTTGDKTYGIPHTIPFGLNHKEAMSIMKEAGIRSK